MHGLLQDRKIRAYALNVIEAHMVCTTNRGLTARDGTAVADAPKSVRSFDFFGCNFHRSLHSAQVIFKRDFLAYLVVAHAAAGVGCVITLVVKNPIVSPKRPLTKKFANGSGLGPKCISREQEKIDPTASPMTARFNRTQYRLVAEIVRIRALKAPDVHIAPAIRPTK
jgi:hypothetical protein